VIFRLIFVLGLSLAVLEAFTSAACAAYSPPPVEVSHWLGIVAVLFTIVVGLLLYAIRSWKPLYYGMLEVIASLFTVYFGVVPAKQPGVATVCNGGVLWGLGCDFQSSLIILAGIYIFVRGMDNMGRQLPNWLPHWMRRWIFQREPSVTR
jgi:hypothetical protein